MEAADAAFFPSSRPITPLVAERLYLTAKNAKDAKRALLFLITCRPLLCGGRNCSHPPRPRRLGEGRRPRRLGQGGTCPSREPHAHHRCAKVEGSSPLLPPRCKGWSTVLRTVLGALASRRPHLRQQRTAALHICGASPAMPSLLPADSCGELSLPPLTLLPGGSAQPRPPW